MSSSIWMRCGGSSNLRRLEGDAFRVVEGQHRISTRKLVDTDAEQALLEELIEGAKPPPPAGTGRLHYLLSTPFRYPPLRHGTRYGARSERGLWYGSETVETAFAEVAYYRLVFLEGTAADLEPLEVELTSFRVHVRTEKGVDLTAPPFDAHRRTLASPTRYDATQRLGHEMRAAGVEAFRAPSARDRGGGTNVALFTPAAFASRTPRDLAGWYCIATHAGVEVRKRTFGRREVLAFPREDYLVRGALPSPAV